MAGIIGIPEVVNNFNMYNGNNRIVGITGEVSIPDLEGLTETISGAGVLGEYDAPAIGRYGSVKFDIPFRCLDPDFFELIDPTEPIMITLRGPVQYTVKATGGSDYIGMRIVIRGKPETISIGTIKLGGQTDSKVTVEATYTSNSTERRGSSLTSSTRFTASTGRTS